MPRKGRGLRCADFSETPMTPQEETVILEARDILGRYLSQNPAIGSWQALMDYCALYADAGIMPTQACKCLNTSQSTACLLA